MIVRSKEGSLLLISFDSDLTKPILKNLEEFISIEQINSMSALENSTGNYGAVIYLIDFMSANHLYNIRYIRNKYPDKQFFVISSTLSIPLLQQSLHIGVNDVFLSPLSAQDKKTLLETLQTKTSVEFIKNKGDLCFTQIRKPHDINGLLEIIERDYIKGPSLQDLANEIHLSPSRICHLFKDSCGIAYSYYLLCRKIEEGERLLTEGKSSITSISYQVGFANPSHFCRTFKEHFNITPTAYLSGNRDVQYSDLYLSYQRLRAELFSGTLAKKGQENSDVFFVGKYNVS
jgi:AraC-like DNA-binding protein